MPLTQAQSRLVADNRYAIRAGTTPTDLAGAGSGLYTAKTAAEMAAWLQAGAPAGWCNLVFNTGLFALAMPSAHNQYLLFVRGGGDPTGEAYSVAHLAGPRLPPFTLPKVNRIAAGAQITASMPLGGATAQGILEWVVAQIV